MFNSAQQRQIVPSAWSDHFSFEFTPADRRAILVSELVQLFTTEAGASFLSSVKRPHHDNAYALDCNYAHLDAALQSQDLTAAMELSPAEALGCISIAAYEVGTSLRA